MKPGRISNQVNPTPLAFAMQGEESNIAPHWGRRALGVYLFLSPLLFWRENIDPFAFPKTLLLLTTVLVLGGLWLVGSLARFGRRDLLQEMKEPVTCGIILYWLSCAFSTLFSLNPQVSWQGAYYSFNGLQSATALTALFLATRWLIRSRTQAETLMHSVVFAAALAGGYALVQALGCDPFSWSNSANIGEYTRPFGTLGHANLLAAYLAMALPVSIWQGWHAWQNGRRINAYVGGLIILSIAVGLLVTLCRGGWLAALISLPVLAAGVGFARRRVMLTMGGCAGIATIIVCGLVFWGPMSLRQSLIQRWQSFTEPSGRLELWRAALSIFRESPVFGSGLDTFYVAFPPHRSLAYWRIEGGLTHYRAHNEALHIMATQGLFGLAAWLLILGGLASAFWRLLRSEPPEGSLFLRALAASALAFYVQNLFFFSTVSYASLFVVIAAIAANLNAEKNTSLASVRKSSASAPFRLIRFACILLIPLLGYAYIFQPWCADIACANAQRHLHDGRHSAALRSMIQAIERQPHQARMHTSLGMAAEACALNSPHAAVRHAYWQQARQAYVEAIRLEPQDLNHASDLARVLGMMAREGLAAPGDALAVFEVVLQRDPHHVQRYVEGSRLALEAGELVRARDWVERGQLQAPNFGPLQAQSAAIHLRQGNAAAAFAILEVPEKYDWTNESQGFLHARCARAESLIRLGRPSEALVVTRELLEGYPEWTAPRYLQALALQALGHAPEALKDLEFVLHREPHHAHAQRKWQELKANN